MITMPFAKSAQGNVEAVPMVQLRSDGTAVDGAGIGHKDNSLNMPPVPNVGANFPGSGLYANYILLKTVATNADRFLLSITNYSTSNVLIVLDDGTAANGVPPNNPSIEILQAATLAGNFGSQFSDPVFRGRAQIYAGSALSGGNFLTVRES